MNDTDTRQNIFEHFNKAKKILIPLAARPSGDGLAAALALSQFLKKLDKEPHVVCQNGLPAKLSFLPDNEQVVSDIEHSSGFVIRVRTDAAPLDELSYHLDEQAGVVDIFLKPKSGQYKPEDVGFRADRFPYDLVVTLNTPSLDMLGDLYDKNTDLFFETPIVNIDHHPNNEHYGELNYIDITATATTEILLELLENFEAGLIDPDIATNLLAGILIETESFRHIKTTPKAFLKASSLVSIGARQQDIVRHLYKTRSVGLLKLWGRALARIKEAQGLPLVYSILREEDLQKAGSRDVEGVFSEMLASLKNNKMVALLAQTGADTVDGHLYIHPNLPLSDIAAILETDKIEESGLRFFIKGKTLSEAEEDFLSRMNKASEILNR